MRTVTVRRGGKLPENMVNESLVVWDKPIHHELKPGDEIPLNALEESYTVEVHDDPPQAYLIVPCEPGKGTHWKESDGFMYCSSGGSCNHKQIPCPLTLEDLETLNKLAYRQCVRSDALPPVQQRLSATLAAWAAVPQAKEAGK